MIFWLVKILYVDEFLDINNRIWYWVEQPDSDLAWYPASMFAGYPLSGKAGNG